ncbi:TerB family tellurite resistance protein [Alcaligenes sp. AB3]|uniref:TerB family tellurite resistance protein n=1 Tax=Alcaligenes sp. AB3 TaxID=2962569 RepID=UPI002882843C|nr:DUF533 domain-containing protein [Alcaligenes sp. AB3]MDT0216554.1 TerB family tellurite resistance protein [Alcaligenes sp. AB3]
MKGKSITQENIKAILAIAIHAAFADSNKDDREREEIRRIAESLAEQTAAPDLARLYQDVLLKRLTLASASMAVADASQRQLAYEMALCVCESDGRLIDSERHFLDELKRLLALTASETDLIEGEADLLADQASAVIPLAPAAGAAAVAASPALASDAELDKSILNYALLNGALELLPQSWASMAIIPLQIKIVDNIGMKLAKTKLPNAPLAAAADLSASNDARIRVDTVHQVKGESLDAVLYIATKEHVTAMLDGVTSEVGRIGYVAVTRARDLLWLGVPANSLSELRPKLVASGFQEIGRPPVLAT